ncbi:hypothetical protein GCM10009747_31170 [Agromyces humatus]|uniref:Uncharacterized protein n=1 Tax=Agromyces humatus TaxID=279573 RepID=A0ABN2KWK9_9MICO
MSEDLAFSAQLPDTVTEWLEPSLSLGILHRALKSNVDYPARNVR